MSITLLIVLLLSFKLIYDNSVKTTRLHLISQAVLVEDLILTKSKNTSTVFKKKPYLAQLSDSLSTRLTLIDLTGDVVFDTSKSQKVFDNHLSRPEIVDALSLGKGFSKRYSQSYSEGFYLLCHSIKSSDTI